MAEGGRAFSTCAPIRMCRGCWRWSDSSRSPLLFVCLNTWTHLHFVFCGPVSLTSPTALTYHLWFLITPSTDCCTFVEHPSFESHRRVDACQTPPLLLSLAPQGEPVQTRGWKLCLSWPSRMSPLMRSLGSVWKAPFSLETPENCWVIYSCSTITASPAISINFRGGGGGGGGVWARSWAQ